MPKNGNSVLIRFLGKEKVLTVKEVEERIANNPLLSENYKKMKTEWKNKFHDFCQGKITLPLTYDPFFKKIFDTNVHPERLSKLLSCLLGFNVKVRGVLSNEDSVITLDAMLIMDILVELDDGSLATVEVQKIPYLFTGERLSCYSSDLLMRQYTRVRGEQGRNFKYSDIKKVYCIVFYEKSTVDMRNGKGDYTHFGKTVFDTGIDVGLLQEYCLIYLDEYRKSRYDKDGKIREGRIKGREIDGWIGLLATEDLSEAENLVNEYPWLEEIYAEISSYMLKPEEVFSMYSDALRILDENTAKYMVEIQQEEIEKLTAEIQEKNAALQEKDMALQKKDMALQEQYTALKEKENIIEHMKKELAKYQE